MKEFAGLDAFAAFATGMVLEVDHAKHQSLEHGAKIIEEEAKRVIGTYDYGWPQLAPSTQAERARQGYAANEPLLREGTLRDSIEHKVISSDEALIGSDLDIAVYQELGTSTIPPRPFLSSAAAHKEDEVARHMGGYVMTTLETGQVPKREIARGLRW